MSETNYVPGSVAKMHEAIQSGFDYVRNLSGRQIAALTIAGGMALGACSGGEAASELPSKSSGSEMTSTTAEGACAPTWVIVEATPSAEHSYTDVIQEIKDAETPEQARVASDVWFGIVKADPDLLAGATMGLLGIEVSASELKDAEGKCATPRAQELATALEFALAASSINPAEAPAGAINSGVDGDGNVVVAETAGIGGDRKAIEIVQMNGKKVYVMARCGNIVFLNGQDIILPEGPTDNITFPPTGPTPKHDDDILPGDGTEASQDHSTPDNPGNGPAGQTPGPDGYLPDEPRPSVPATTTPNTNPVTTGPPATVGPQPTSTQAPVTATTTVNTTAPQNSTLPPRP